MRLMGAGRPAPHTSDQRSCMGHSPGLLTHPAPLQLDLSELSSQPRAELVPNNPGWQPMAQDLELPFY